MSKKIPYYFGIIITMLLGSWLYVMYCCPCCSEETIPTKPETTISNVNTKKTTLTESNPFAFHFSTPDITYSCIDNFNFKSSNFALLLPIADSLGLGIALMKEAVEKGEGKLKLFGLYQDNESNTSIFPNLGLARANAVKNYLVSQGIAEKNIEISELVEENLNFDNDTVFGAMRFEWIPNKILGNATKNWAEIKKNSKANPLTLYFETGQSTISLTQQQKKQFAEIVDYINHVEGAKISITGHSDNDPGVRHTNQYYSEQRAQFAKAYFVSNGIPENKIEVSGKGELQPIADNSTEVGRAKNRRTEITIK
ncbi:OmpA family protein [Flavobacterium sp. NRK F7]|uniref:OmpA family protein n=1 Tax=Flavobacterium sp. NRK F7 TaxID=2954930 RepID=UPI002091C8DF|nr:OmpA family protein [Flavobacterium sp. NRK F7]MCO6161343.1 OmpA family protein [Flavobacterium sp. NRK F7]